MPWVRSKGLKGQHPPGCPQHREGQQGRGWGGRKTLSSASLDWRAGGGLQTGVEGVGWEDRDR